MLRSGVIWNQCFNWPDVVNFLVLMQCFVFRRHNASTRNGKNLIIVLVLMLASRPFSRWNKSCYACVCACVCVCFASENQVLMHTLSITYSPISTDVINNVINKVSFLITSIYHFPQGQIQRVNAGHVPHAASPGERTRGRSFTYLGNFYRGLWEPRWQGEPWHPFSNKGYSSRLLHFTG